MKDFVVYINNDKEKQKEATKTQPTSNQNSSPQSGQKAQDKIEHRGLIKGKDWQEEYRNKRISKASCCVCFICG